MLPMQLVRMVLVLSCLPQTSVRVVHPDLENEEADRDLREGLPGAGQSRHENLVCVVDVGQAQDLLEQRCPDCMAQVYSIVH